MLLTIVNIYCIINSVIVMNYTDFFKALSDENRLAVLTTLVNGKKSAGEILKMLNISQPTLSHHMKILCDSGAVICKKSGRHIYYVISTEAMTLASDFLLSLSRADDELKVKASGKTVQRKAPRKKEEKPIETERQTENRQSDIWLF